MLTDDIIRNVVAVGKPVKRSDAHGLFIHVSVSGRRTWYLAYRLDDKQKTLKGGSYPEISLHRARLWCEEMRAFLKPGHDPAEQVKADAFNSKMAQMTFEALALEWLEARRPSWSPRYAQHGRTRDRVLFDLAIDSKLRGCDLVKIRISDIVCDRKIRTRATVVQQKTGRPVQFELMDDARASLLKWLELRCEALEDFAFASRTDHATHISTRQYARMGRWNWLAQRELWDPLSTTDQGIDHLQGDRESPRGPDFTWAHEDRKHGPIPRS